jgi:hypothetical protein
VDNFLLAALPEPFTILGQRLLPLSIGRVLYLQRFGCDPVTCLDQLLRAIIICSRPLPEVGPAFSDPHLADQLAKWSKDIGKFDLAEKIDLFHEYVSEHTTRGPIVLEEDEGGSPSADAPWLHHLTVTLCSALGYSRAEALELPYSLALWDYYGYWETKGRAHILGDRRRQMHDLANIMHAQTLATLEKPEVRDQKSEKEPGASSPSDLCSPTSVLFPPEASCPT